MEIFYTTLLAVTFVAIGAMSLVILSKLFAGQR
jgi:hypothetical protein